MDPHKQLSVLLPIVCDVVDGITDDQLSAPTPCADFTVADILDHMITLGGAFSYWFRGEEPPMAAGPVVEHRVPVVSFRKTMDALLESVASPGALDRMIEAPVGVMPGDAFARLVAFDGLIHGWDLAQATGQAYDPDIEVLAAVEGFITEALTPDQRGDAFAPAKAAAETGSALERLVAFSGRDVA